MERNERIKEGFKQMQEMKEQNEKDKKLLVIEMLVHLEVFMDDGEEFEDLIDRIKESFGIDYKTSAMEYHDNLRDIIEGK